MLLIKRCVSPKWSMCEFAINTFYDLTQLRDQLKLINQLEVRTYLFKVECCAIRLATQTYITCVFPANVIKMK